MVPHSEQPVRSPHEVDAASSAPIRVCFFFNAQKHQLLHAAPTAIAMSRDPRFIVHVLAPTTEQIDFVRDLADGQDGGALRLELAGGARLQRFARLTGGSIPPKLLTLVAARSRLAAFDAIVVPERTSLLLRRMGLRHLPFLHTTHGAGDRAVGYERRIRQFDFVLLAGEKQRRRMLEKGVIREGGYAVVGYPKFDTVRNAAARPAGLFPNDRPTVLYNPHCNRALSSWPAMGEAVLRQFAADPRYNLIVAPHVKLFDGRRARRRAERRLDAFAALPNIHIDLGSARSVDMTYPTAADVYLGDVSSQVYEFLSRPRPCLFLNAHGAAWRGDENYAHWRYGPVIDEVEHLPDAVDAARESHAAYAEAQRHGIDETFDLKDTASSVRAAEALAAFLLEWKAGRGLG